MSTGPGVEERGIPYRVTEDPATRERVLESRSAITRAAGYQTTVKPASGRHESPKSTTKNIPLADEEEAVGRGSEITLSVTGVLFLVLLLGLTCGGFFFYGYNAGHNAEQAANGAGTPADPDFGSFKPTPGTPAMQPIAGYDANGNPIGNNPSVNAADAEMNATAPEGGNTVEAATIPASAPAAADATSQSPDSQASVSQTSGSTLGSSGSISGPTTASAPESAIGSLRPRQPVALQVSASGPVASAIADNSSFTDRTQQATGPLTVQVAAVSSEDDAVALLNALTKRGFAAVSEISPGDQLIHVQLGPFNTRADAEAMQRRLLADGFNALIR